MHVDHVSYCLFNFSVPLGVTFTFIFLGTGSRDAADLIQPIIDSGFKFDYVLFSPNVAVSEGIHLIFSLSPIIVFSPVRKSSSRSVKNYQQSHKNCSILVILRNCRVGK